MKVGLVAQAGRNWVGGAQYVANLSRALRAVGARVVLVGTAATDLDLYEELGTEADERRLGRALPRPIRAVRRGIFEAAHVDLELLSLLASARVDVAYPFFAGRLGRLAPFRHAAWIADLQHKHMPELFSRDELGRRDRLFARVARMAPGIVLSSRSAERDLTRHFPSSLGRTHVLRFRSPAPEAAFAEDPETVRIRYRLPDRFFLVSNQFWKHKNHEVVFAALERLSSTGSVPTVACTGLVADYRDPTVRERIDRRLENAGLSRFVRLLGQIPRADQLALMRRCDAVIQPSLFEGWSTVIEDARGLGTPVIASNIEVHREQTTDLAAASLFEPDSPDALARQLRTHPGFDADRLRRRSDTSTTLAHFGRDFASIVHALPAPRLSRSRALSVETPAPVVSRATERK